MYKKNIDRIKMSLEYYFIFHSDSDRKTLEEKGVNFNNMVCIEIKGDGMTPTIKDGDCVLIDKDKTELEEGEVFMIKHYEQNIIRRVQQGKNKTIVLQRDNNEYPRRTVKKSDIEIFGKVVGVVEKQ
jgi:phage repressor protein C with HTH and peptisase S24 domain